MTVAGRAGALICTAAVTVSAVAVPGLAAGSARAAAPRATPRECQTAQLHLTFGDTQGAAGHYISTLSFVNRGGTCTLRGYPGVSAVSRGGAQIGLAAMRERAGIRISTVTLTTGSSAQTAVEVVDTGAFSRAQCRPTTAYGLKVFPPDQQAARTIRVRGLLVCARAVKGTIGVQPIRRRVAG